MHAHMHVGSPPSSRCGYIVYRDLNDFSWQLLLSRSSLCSRKTMKCSSVPVFLIDAANSSVPSVLQHRMGFPGVGSWDHGYSACPVVLFFGFFSLPPAQLLLLHNVNTPPSRDSAHPLVCRSQSRRTQESHQAVVPALVLPARIIATWGLCICRARSLGPVCMPVDE
jgi:hypothetical protein